MCNDKSSYKCIVEDGPIKSDGDYSANNDMANVLAFGEYEDIKIPKQLEAAFTKSVHGSKRRFLVEILEPMVEVTLNVNDVFGFHGIGDELQVGTVLDCLEASIKTDFDRNSRKYREDSEGASDDE
jgi:hypothetical protein